MKLIELKCKNCGAILKADAELDKITCEFCHTTFKIDDEVKHVKFDDMEMNGYEFEKGRIRAQKERMAEFNSNNTNTQPVQQTKSHKTTWLILAWIFLFPFTATYFIFKSKKMSMAVKIILTIVVWVFFLTTVYISKKEEKEKKRNKIVSCYSQEVYNKLDSLFGIDNISGNFDTTYTCDNLVLRDSHSKEIKITYDKKTKHLTIKVEDETLFDDVLN